MKLIYNVEDRMGFGKLIVFAVRQLLAIMAATLVVPMIVGHGMKSEAALFGAGVGTLVYVAFTKKRVRYFSALRLHFSALWRRRLPASGLRQESMR